MDDIVLLSLGVISLIAVFAVGYFVYRGKAGPKENEGDGPVRPRPLGPGRDANLPPGARRRRPVDRLRRAREEEERRLQDDSDEEGSAEEEFNAFDYIAQPEGKIGKKKMAKLEEKARKKVEREQMERERAEQKERDALLEQERLKEEARQRRLEKEKEEEERKAKEEKERQEYEEYLKMKEQFSIDEEGTDVMMESEETELMQKFLDTIKNMKVVILEDLAAQFNLKTQDVIDRIETFMSNGSLTGVLDDRGKFIYITMDELEAVAKFINQRGRVSIQELAESSNRLIRLTPEI